MSLVRVSGFEAVDTLVTDAPPPAEIADALKAAKVEVVLAPSSVPLDA